MSMILKLRAGPLPTPFFVLVLRTVLPFHIFFALLAFEVTTSFI